MDNIRFATIILVLVYHVCYLFNGVGILGGVGIKKSLSVFDALLYIVYPWFMVLLFLISGISTRYSLQNRSCKQFLGERLIKLLIPSTLGLFIYHWITGYLNIKIGGGLDYIPLFLYYPIFVISGIGPLWFIQMLFLFSLIAALLKKIDKRDKIWNFCSKTNTIIIILLAILIWVSSQILNMPVLIMYRFGIYLVSFLIGYFIFSHDKVQDSIEKIHIPMLILSIILSISYVIYYFGTDYTSPQCLQSIFTNIYLWVMVLAILGCGKVWLNRTSSFFSYVTKSSFGMYIIHYPILMVICYLLYYHFNLSIMLNYIVALFVEIIFTVVLLELFKRIPVIRFLVLGIYNINEK